MSTTTKVAIVLGALHHEGEEGTGYEAWVAWIRYGRREIGLDLTLAESKRKGLTLRRLRPLAKALGCRVEVVP